MQGTGFSDVPSSYAQPAAAAPMAQGVVNGSDGGCICAQDCITTLHRSGSGMVYGAWCIPSFAHCTWTLGSMTCGRLSQCVLSCEKLWSLLSLSVLMCRWPDDRGHWYTCYDGGKAHWEGWRDYQAATVLNKHQGRIHALISLTKWKRLLTSLHEDTTSILTVAQQQLNAVRLCRCKLITRHPETQRGWPSLEALVRQWALPGDRWSRSWHLMRLVLEAPSTLSSAHRRELLPSRASWSSVLGKSEQWHQRCQKVCSQATGGPSGVLAQPNSALNPFMQWKAAMWLLHRSLTVLGSSAGHCGAHHWPWGRDHQGAAAGQPGAHRGGPELPWGPAPPREHLRAPGRGRSRCQDGAGAHQRGAWQRAVHHPEGDCLPCLWGPSPRIRCTCYGASHVNWLVAYALSDALHCHLGHLAPLHPWQLWQAC